MPMTPDDLRSAIIEQLIQESRGGAKSNQAMQRARQEDPGDSIAGSMMSPEELDYLVDIERRDVWGDPDPETGKREKIGWDKKVHRYAEPKGKAKPLGKKRRGGS